MPEEIVMPRLSDTMEEGTIARWLKSEGETVHKGDVILEVETDKATMPLEAYSEGVIQKILQPDGATVPLGAVIGLLAKTGEAAPAPRAERDDHGDKQAEKAPAPGASEPVRAGVAPADQAARQTPERAAATVRAAPPAQTVDGGAATAHNGAEGGRVKATPLARNLARHHNIDLGSLGGQGSGPGGRIVKLDIEQFLAQQGAAVTTAAPQPAGPPGAVDAAPSPAPAPQPAAAAGGDDTLRKPSRIQQVMARRLLESKTTVPHFYVTNEVDMGAAAELRTQLQATFGDEGKVTYNHLIIRACALTLRAMPQVNTSWRDGQFAVHTHVNIGVAVDVPDGLLVPVIRDADRKGLREIAVEARDLAAKAREGKLTLRDMEGGTFSISNLGPFDVAEFQAIINPPESAILAVSSILDKPVAVDGQVVVRPRMQLTLSVDHRVIPGVPAAQFLQGVKKLLQEPLRLGF